MFVETKSLIGVTSNIHIPDKSHIKRGQLIRPIHYWFSSLILNYYGIYPIHVVGCMKPNLLWHCSQPLFVDVIPSVAHINHWFWENLDVFQRGVCVIVYFQFVFLMCDWILRLMTVICVLHVNRAKCTSVFTKLN